MDCFPHPPLLFSRPSLHLMPGSLASRKPPGPPSVPDGEVTRRTWLARLAKRKVGAGKILPGIRARRSLLLGSQFVRMIVEPLLRFALQKFLQFRGQFRLDFLKVVAGCLVTVGRGQFPPKQGFKVVPRDSLAGVITVAQSVLGVGQSLFRGADTISLN